MNTSQTETAQPVNGKRSDLLVIPPATVIREDLSHHMLASSIDNFVSYLDYEQQIGAQQEWDGLVPKRLTRRIIERSGHLWYYHHSVVTEFYVSFLMRFARHRIFHFMNANNAYYFAGIHKNSNKLVCTYHQSEDVHKKTSPAKRHLQHIDAAVVVGSSQVPYFASLLGAERVFNVTLGVDTDVFAPGRGQDPADETFVCLFVGHWLRDIPMLLEVASLLSKERSLIEFWVVTADKNRELFRGAEGIRFFSNIPLEDLVRMYQRAHLFVCPLLDCTANSAILEALASGLPVITTKAGSIADYVDETCGMVTPRGDVDGMAHAIVKLVDNAQQRLLLAAQARDRAVTRFSWPVVATALQSVYETVAKR